MHRYLRVCAAVVASAALGCGSKGGKGAPDGAPSDGREAVCAGDRWGASAEMLEAIVGCTIITGNLSITGNQLVSAELPLLTRVDGFLSVWGNPVLTRVTFAKLASVGGYLDVSANVALTSLEMPALKNVNERAVPAAHDVVIRDNALPTCRAEAIREQLAASGFRGTVSISGNGSACPP
jgi:hypothetical protein